MLVAAINAHSAVYAAGQIARPTLLSPLSSSPSWFGSYDSDAPRPARRQKATLPRRQSSAVVAKTDSVRQTRFPDALPITR